MQLLKFKVIEWEAAQDLLDEQIQQTEAATDLPELVDELRQQKAELDRMCNELREEQLTQEEFDTVAAESARRNCKWLKTKQKVRSLHGSNLRASGHSPVTKQLKHTPLKLMSRPVKNRWYIQTDFQIGLDSLAQLEQCFKQCAY